MTNDILDSYIYSYHESSFARNIIHTIEMRVIPLSSRERGEPCSICQINQRILMRVLRVFVLVQSIGKERKKKKMRVIFVER